MTILFFDKGRPPLKLSDWEVPQYKIRCDVCIPDDMVFVLFVTTCNLCFENCSSRHIVGLCYVRSCMAMLCTLYASLIMHPNMP